MLINENWKIESDELNVTLYQKFTRRGNNAEYWRPHRYYSSVSEALKGLVDIEINRTGLKDLEAVNKRINEVHDWISRAFENTRIHTRNVTSLKEARKKDGKGKSSSRQKELVKA